ncbi:pyruvate dehydrogenase (acetyl-transferring), homodimeric type [Massilia sp. YIM B02763]|uniref:pyruvate dehydrogenase (acetyl-transferring), homodimeric type n=1 Tax=Massilia sp. YIM B02763 TaxID=3050130 RepID=UPI0025B6D0CC|nr:pyruvate dehydrogenase (acetyl-transferring), homodimeric type [Massilia sp. YIM B02763]MDN4056240.1 pyruvate dehydrogenase (acetyl-transferring), homodimeric type [Massilia sp. YIM B02763]
MSAQLDQLTAQAANDPDSLETKEWLDALEAVIEFEGTDRAHYLLERLVDLARRRGAHVPFSSNTAYVNTIPAHLEEHCPGNLEYEERLRSWMRWNAMAMVVKANRADGDLGGHISSFASLANMLGIGFNHFWQAPSENHGGDLLYIQGHSSPGIYARAFLEGRISEEQLLNFRREVDGKGLSSYPHPKLMPDFWQFPTVSMGLGPLMAIYQARFLKYLHARGIADTEARKVWVFCGDGEMDEPESMGAIGMAAREKLDNLVMVVNCNLQRLDGPVRGNGKIIQELEADFRGAGWNVIKVVWGSQWDALLAKDKDGILQRVMMETVDGEYQNYKAKDGAYVRKHFFGKHPELLKMVANMSDDDIWRLTRGGHDPHKIYAAFKKAQENKGTPTVLLVKTVKGFGMGKSGEARNTAHQTKKLDDEAIREMRDRFAIPIPDDKLADIPFFKPSDDAPEMKYLHERRKALGGYLPQRREQADEKLTVPALETFKAVLDPTAAGREISTTQAYVRVITALLKDQSLGQRIVPILVDESRTFGMEGLFRQIGIFSQQGQLYEPVDKDQVMYYREDKAGQILQEGINEAGGMSSWIAAATSYSTNNRVMIPFYTFYSMFGMQRVGDLVWLAGDIRARGFLMGGTAGRTTLNGEGLQHEDGHSHIIAATVPNCIPYDPTYAHEVAVIIQDGLHRMVEKQEDVFYYITIMNENYEQPGLKEGQQEGILKGMYLLQEGDKSAANRVQLMGSGTILRESVFAAELLQNDWGVAADVWSCPSLTLLARDGQDVDRWNLVHPTEEARLPYVTQLLKDTSGPIVATTDYMRLFAEQIRAYIPSGRTYKVLGTDGFGRSDSRAKLREFFEVNRYYITVAALKSLAEEGKIPASKVAEAIAKYGIDPNKPNPVTQ